MPSVCISVSSPGHFSRVFRKYVSMSPSDYRKKYLN
ncbi:MAG: helix-turn-helix domain-containing protein [Coprococcus sp.]